MPQSQHVITEWLLKMFARTAPGGLTLSVFDKQLDAIVSDVPSQFMAKLDDHSHTVEAGLARLEGAAAQPARRLVARAAAVEPGLWPLYGPTDNLAEIGDLVEVPSPDAEVRLFAPTRWLAEPPPADREKIARYLTVMFPRSTKLERAILDVSAAVRAGYVQMVNSMAPAMLASVLPVLDEYLEDARFIGLRMPDDLAATFAAADWYVVRAPDAAPFLLGDSPVVSTIQVGHETDSWRPLLSPETYAVCMPLSTTTCLIVAPQRLVPVGVASPLEMADAINRLTWRWADRYVVGPTDASLVRVRDTLPTDQVLSTLTMDIEPEKAFGRGLLTAWKVLEVELEKLSHYCRPLAPFPGSIRDAGASTTGSATPAPTGQPALNDRSPVRAVAAQ